MCAGCDSAKQGFAEGNSTSTGKTLPTSVDQGTSPDWKNAGAQEQG
jgi:hypothetical protein